MSDSHIEKTEDGVIDWKMEVERLNRLLVQAEQRCITNCTDGELRNELYRRAQIFLGDPSKGVTLPLYDWRFHEDH